MEYSAVNCFLEEHMRQMGEEKTAEDSPAAQKFANLQGNKEKQPKPSSQSATAVEKPVKARINKKLKDNVLKVIVVPTTSESRFSSFKKKM